MIELRFSTVSMPNCGVFFAFLKVFFLCSVSAKSVCELKSTKQKHTCLKVQVVNFLWNRTVPNQTSSITSNADYSSLMPLWKLLVRHYEFTHQRISIYIWTCLNEMTTQSCRIRCYFLFYVEVFFGINVHNLYHVLIV